MLSLPRFSFMSSQEILFGFIIIILSTFWAMYDYSIHWQFATLTDDHLQNHSHTVFMLHFYDSFGMIPYSIILRLSLVLQI